MLSGCPRGLRHGEIKQMSDAQIQQMVDVFQYYGQGTAKIPEDLVKRID